MASIVAMKNKGEECIARLKDSPSVEADLVAAATKHGGG